MFEERAAGLVTQFKRSFKDMYNDSLAVLALQ